jgi:hypothetical protein
VPGGIAKAFGLDDGPTYTQIAVAKGRTLDDATKPYVDCLTVNKQVQASGLLSPTIRSQLPI